MDLSQFKLESLTCPIWIDKYISEMGEDKFWDYKNKVYTQLDSLKVGQSLEIKIWVKSENYDLFIKIACCFISETHCCYQFNNDYSIIKHQFDYEAMVRISEKLRVQAHTQKTIATNS